MKIAILLMFGIGIGRTAAFAQQFDHSVAVRRRYFSIWEVGVLVSATIGGQFGGSCIPRFVGISGLPAAAMQRSTLSHRFWVRDLLSNISMC